MGDGPSAGGGAFLPELSDAVIDVLASSYSNAPADASAIWNDFRGAVTRVPIEATAVSLRRRGFDLFICAPWQGAEARRRTRHGCAACMTLCSRMPRASTLTTWRTKERHACARRTVRTTRVYHE